MIELPEPNYYATFTADSSIIYNPYYTADQMQAYGEACRKAALEEAAKVCEAYEELGLFEHGHTTMYGGVRADAACGLAKEIRRLK